MYDKYSNIGFVGLSLARVIHIFLPVVLEGKHITIDLVVFRKFLLLDDIKAVMSHGKNSTALVRIHSRVASSFLVHV